MAREKDGFRELLEILMEKYPMLLSKGEACDALGCSRDHLRTVIMRGHIKVKDGKIPIGAIASYLCAT